MFGYLEELIAAAIFVFLFAKHRQVILLAWAGVFAFLALDDAFQGHEKVGGRIARGLSLDSFSFLGVDGIRGQDLGELIAAGFFLVPILVGLSFGYVRATPRWRRFSIGLVGLLAVLAFCGVVVDFFVNALDSESLNILEDGGEMVMLSVMLWFTIRALSDDENRAPTPNPTR